MPYLCGSLAKECLVTLSTSNKCSGIRCYAKRVGEQYLNEGAKSVGIAAGIVIGSAALTTAAGVGGAIVGSATKCVMNPPKTYVGATLCVAGIAFYGASKL